jgi:aminomethyltransferase
VKKTVLHSKHVFLNAKMAEFAGYEMPIQYSGIVDEHMSVRNNAGIFDVSHMGNIFIQGSESDKFLQKIVTGDIYKAESGRAFYTLMCYPNGGAVDDLFVYCLGIKHYMMIVNAANSEKDFLWMKEHLEGDVSIENLTDQYAIIAVQGPSALRILDDVCENKVSDMAPFTITRNRIKDREFYISSTGYTGEAGCEISVKSESAEIIWDTVIQAGVKPCGLGARDTLRLEMGFTLYGHEIDQDTNVLEAGLGWIVDLEGKDDFIGKSALCKSKEAGLKKKLVGLLVESKGIPRIGCMVYQGENELGRITSGGHSPVLGKGIALASVQRQSVKLDDVVDIDIRGKRVPARVVKRKFIQK